jgi:uncharacterized repeat protein (TIGR01451 family)
LALSAGSATAAAAGDTILYRVEVRLKNPAQSSGVTKAVVTDALPEATQLVSTKVNRGPGCTGSSTLVCNLDFLAGDLVGVVEIVVRVTKAGTLVNMASVSAPEADPDPTNNKASLIITAPPVVFTPPTPTLAAPRLTQSSGATAKALRASRAGSLSRITKLLRVDTKATVTLEVRDLRSGKLLTLQRGSRLAEMTLKRRATTARTRIAGARTFALKALLPTRQLRRGSHFQLELIATGVNGKTTQLKLGFIG